MARTSGPIGMPTQTGTHALVVGWSATRKQPPQNAGATRIEHHCGTCGDHDATGFFFSLYLLTCLDRYRTDLASSAGRPFSATHFLGHCFGLIPASGSFAASAFPVPPLHHWVPSDKAAARFGSRSHSLLGAPRKWGKKKEKIQLCLTSTL